MRSLWQLTSSYLKIEDKKKKKSQDDLNKWTASKPNIQILTISFSFVFTQCTSFNPMKN